MKHVSRLFLLSFICFTTIKAAESRKHTYNFPEDERESKRVAISQKDFDHAWAVASLERKLNNLITPSPELTTLEVLQQQEEEYDSAINLYVTELKKKNKASSAPASLASSRPDTPMS